MKNIFQVMVLHIKHKHESYLHHVDWVGPEVMLVSLFHNCLEVILITNWLIGTFVIKIELLLQVASKIYRLQLKSD